MKLSAKQINLMMDAISDAMQYAREHQEEKEYKQKKDDYRKLYHELSNLLYNEVI